MRGRARFAIASFLSALTLLVGSAAPARAMKAVDPPPDVEGTFRYNDHGYKITVGYSCHHTFPEGTDPDPNFYVSASHGRSFIETFTHRFPDDLVFTLLGFHLSDEAAQALRDDAATIVCDALSTTNDADTESAGIAQEPSAVTANDSVDNDDAHESDPHTDAMGANPDTASEATELPGEPIEAPAPVGLYG